MATSAGVSWAPRERCMYQLGDFLQQVPENATQMAWIRRSLSLSHLSSCGSRLGNLSQRCHQKPGSSVSAFWSLACQPRRSRRKTAAVAPSITSLNIMSKHWQRIRHLLGPRTPAADCPKWYHYSVPSQSQQTNGSSKYGPWASSTSVRWHLQTMSNKPSR